MQIIFQDPFGSLNPRMTIGQTVSEGLRIVGIPRGSRRKDRLEALLGMVGMSPAAADRYPHEFSGGQRQRIGIARALSVDPSLLICDEPVSALDVSIQAQVINLLGDLQDRRGIGYLLIYHDLNVVGYLCSEVAVMYRGHIVEYAPTGELFENPQHPYTLSLLSAIPDPEGDTEHGLPALEDVSQDIPDPPSGCDLPGRCTGEEPWCRRSRNLLEAVGGNHFVRC